MIEPGHPKLSVGAQCRLLERVWFDAIQDSLVA